MEKQDFFLPAIFSDGMVLQRRAPIRIFGEAADGAIVTACLHGHTAQCVATDGRFCITFPAMEAEIGLLLTVSCGQQSLCIRDVAIGEVWIAGGQSNMELSLRYGLDRTQGPVIPHDPLLRHFRVPRRVYAGHSRDTKAYREDSWLYASRRTQPYLSAVAYYFAQALRKTLGVPVGIVDTSHGGTPAEAWIPQDTLRASEVGQAHLAAYEAELALGNPDAWLSARIASEITSCTPAARRFSDRYLRGKIHADQGGSVAKQLAQPRTPYSPQRPGGLYETMVMTVAGFSASGFLWYQGESDHEHPEGYRALQTMAIDMWRKAWGSPLPFLFVQLAGFVSDPFVSPTGLPMLRHQQQLVSETVPDAYMVTAFDVGDAHNNHPPRKRPVGERLAAAALSEVYGIPTPWRSPRAVRATYTSGTVNVRFEGETPLTQKEIQAREIALFAGEHLLHAGTITVEGDCLRIVCAHRPTEVRYAWSGCPEAWLYSASGLPALPFCLPVEST